MPRYDQDRGRSGAWPPYARDFDRGPAPRGGPYGGDFRPHTGFGGGGAKAEFGRGQDPFGGGIPDDFGGEWESGPVYGPARYGLGPYHQRLRTRRRPDEEVRKDVEDALFFDTWVDAESITVEVKEGVVTLTGELPDYQEVRYATDDVWDVDGVRGVHCQLTVNSGKRPPVDGVPRGQNTGNGRSA
ncbi:MAG TPA: BON domain-containing protein [Longimicrobium sp.]|nr:BON domain-containing protein [Longimicrobium sp.]